MDKVSPEKRSEIMAKVRSKGNRSTELRLAEIFRAAGISGWRRNVPLLGRPDFVFLKQRLVIFADGCFWHGCKKCCRLPQSNRQYWREKIEANQLRDKRNTRKLRSMGWRVLRIWEHSIKGFDTVVMRLQKAFTHNR